MLSATKLRSARKAMQSRSPTANRKRKLLQNLTSQLIFHNNKINILYHTINMLICYTYFLLCDIQR